MRTILLFTSDRRPTTLAKISGIYRYAKIAHWNVQVFEDSNVSSKVSELIDFWNPAGCILECGKTGIPPQRGEFGKIPVVYLDADPRKTDRKRPSVCHDSEADGRIAAKELISIGCTSFAFIAYPGDLFWSRDREAAFIKFLRLNGKTCKRLHPTSAPNDNISLGSEIRDFLVTLPDGCGIFTANDFLGSTTVLICTALQRNVPEELAVISVDNNEQLCTNTTPQLTSIAPDFEQGGYLAAKLLDDSIRNRRRKAAKATFGPIALIRRASTTKRKVHDANISKAISLITSRYGAITATEVLGVMNCSRRNAEIRFRASTQKSILEFIQTVRFEVACDLLRQKRLPLQGIAERVGYRSMATFDRFFRQRTHKSPTDWIASRIPGADM